MSGENNGFFRLSSGLFDVFELFHFLKQKDTREQKNENRLHKKITGNKISDLLTVITETRK